jgi:hypothetical protein
MMSLDAYEIKDEFIVKAELPGVQKENLDISLDGDMLRVEAQKKAEEETIDHCYICESGYCYGSRLDAPELSHSASPPIPDKEVPLPPRAVPPVLYEEGCPGPDWNPGV